jgi:SAM-dependent methyltransferase
MKEDPNRSKPRSYHADWDTYVENWDFYATLEPSNRNRTDLALPGDEWGTEKEWERITNMYLKPCLPKDSNGIAVEIGQGSGKYTLRVADSVSKIVCFDVSKKFIEIARSKLKEHIEQGTVFLEFLDLHNCYEIRDRIQKHDLIGKVDLFFSIDSMQHVELHTLFAYFINAAICLRIGGHMVITAGICTNDDGFERLLMEIPWCYGGHRPSHQFYFLSKDIIWYCLERLGFEIVKHEEDRDILFVARKTQGAEEKVGDIQSIYAELVEAVAKKDRHTKKEDVGLKDLVSQLTIQLEAAEADRKARLEVIERQEKEFSERLKKSENDRAARLEAIKELGIKLDAAEADRAARLEVIKDVCNKLEFSEGKRDRLENEIQRLRTLKGFLKDFLRRKLKR